MKDPVFEMDDEEIDVSLPPDKRFEMDDINPVIIPPDTALQTRIYTEFDEEVTFYSKPKDDSPTTLLMLAETLGNLGQPLDVKGLLKPTLSNGLNTVEDWQAFKELTGLSNDDLQSLPDHAVSAALSANCLHRLIFKICYLKVVFKIQSITSTKRQNKHQVG